MTSRIDELIRKTHELEAELEVEYRKKREEFEFVIREKRVRFAEEVARQQRLFRSGVISYLMASRLLNVLTAPLIYLGFIPFVLLDLFLYLFQTVCFPVYDIAKVRRADYLVFDRADLPYLNVIKKFNCFYCSYGNGLAAYAREVVARTEQYWCPIKHARRIRTAHARYPRFFEFGDARSYRKGLERLRKELAARKQG